MSRNYLPDTDAGLLAWSGTFGALITATPTAYGLTAAQATAYATTRSAYATAYAAAIAPETRGGSVIYAKRQAFVNLAKASRALVKQIQGVPTVTNQQRYDLGISVPVVKQRIPPPSVSPLLAVKKVDGATVTISLRDPSDAKRRKPAGAQGIFVYSYIGPTPPSDPSLWKAEGGTTRTLVEVVFPLSAEPFSRVWIAAQYYNPRSETGPACVPVSTNLGTWMVQNVAQEETTSLKRAA